MYQTFTGSSRRHRQVNLSGRPSNPFAAASSIPGSGPQSAILSAQQDRVQRQQQRERLQASTRIQRVWRGHSARRKTFGLWRQIWDEYEDKHTTSNGAYHDPDESLAQLTRLMLFYNGRENKDVSRVTWYGMRQIATESKTPCSGGPWPKAYLRLARACTAALRSRTRANHESDAALLKVLAFAARRCNLGSSDALQYYEALTAPSSTTLPSSPLRDALLAPLASSDAYTGLLRLLAQPIAVDLLDLLRSHIDVQALSDALGRELVETSTGSIRAKLWLLGNFIFLAGRSNASFSTPKYILAVSGLMGSLADDVDFDSAPIDMDNAAFDREVLAKVATGLPLNTYLYEQITSLIDQTTIRNLLVRTTELSPNGSGGSQHAQVYAGYALTLLRCFPRRADDLRMWLYLGPTSSSESDLPATQYFWYASRSSQSFQTIWRNSRDVVALLQASAQNTTGYKEDWTLILLFLELYTFMLKIMDDEEFMGSSGKRSSAIPISDVAELVTFLKNLGFTLYFNASVLNEDAGDSARDARPVSLARHFGTATMSEQNGMVPEPKPFTLAGLPGLTIDYLKALVTGLLRAVYERDSRRHFLPKNHWLMTDRFDMTSFIPGVVAEEENRHLVQDQDDEDKDDASSDEDTPRQIVSSHMNALRSQQARERRMRKASRRRYLESVAPRLEILQNMPFFIPFTTRVEIFRQFVHLDQEKRRNGHVDPDLWRQSMMFQPPNGMPPRDMLARHHAKIRRKNEFADAFEQFYDLGGDLKEPIQITFVDEFDIPEAGIDGGGVTKEFLTSVITQAFGPDADFFSETETHFLHPKPTAIEDLKVRLRNMGFKEHSMRGEVKSLLQQYEFLGRIIGKCLYEGILVDVSFAGFFLKKWALTGGMHSAPMETGYRANINDLKELDEGLYRGLLALKNAPAEQVEDFGLTFTIDDLVGPDDDRHVVERELVPGGANTSVTAENRLIYINRMSWYRLQGQSAQQTNAFLKGISSIVQPSWLSMFNQTELQTLIGGAAANIDVADLRRNTLYGGTYVIGDDGREHPSIQLFWKVMAQLPDEDRRKVLKFVTSTPRGPLLGFGQLNPRFSIRDSGSDENRFPTTSTCVNLLKLPMYKSERMLRDKLLAAVNSGAGFDLS
ncbi:hypothetical protein BAUCODRAFT_416336 [Baudoinia panamericana UAMH 10762]|uniref:HECT-type E3 ubiquitin transferase n=1 Tax=Baudoinia panamericana (strain UAMH 10762) TaxID=717646 RepID=M2NGS8_BAUPA|nr:uncharacterized protein BAUCODRAFT_416336 [Baudoinia panamericana UAMH 10762]EMC98215.1 hypothetical protein BAUCODRAFT_416336 [Baudoinia panamericana UAMH 10762]